VACGQADGRGGSLVSFFCCYKQSSIKAKQRVSVDARIIK
jgi:uncharacterized lipoprotein YbaY